MPRRDHFHSVQRKFYQLRRFKNPYFQHAEKGRRFLPVLIVIAVFAALLSATGFLLASPMFAYTTVTVEGTQTISPDDVSAIVTGYLNQPYALLLKRSNRFLFKSESLAETLGSRFAFETLDIRTEKQTVHIAVKEKTSQLLWTSGGRTYLAARDGLAIRELAEAEKTEVTATFPAFVDLNDVPVVIGQPVLSAEDVEAIFRFHEHLRAQNIVFRETRLDRKVGKWVSVVTEVGYGILIDPGQDMERQAANLETILRESIPDPAGLEYVDLRFDDHVYYKFR